jgi:hypothetical protein
LQLSCSADPTKLASTSILLTKVAEEVQQLLNPLFSGRRDLIIGQEVVNFNHVKMIYNTFKVDDHKLKIEDIERMYR